MTQLAAVAPNSNPLGRPQKYFKLQHEIKRQCSFLGWGHLEVKEYFVGFIT